MTRDAFSPFGALIDFDDASSFLINRGRCRRFHARAIVDASDGEVAFSLFRDQRQSLPVTVDLFERHPRGSQAFVPLGQVSILLVVAHDGGGKPLSPHAFACSARQPFQIRRNVWHAPLITLKPQGAPCDAPADVLVVDRVGDGNNLEEYALQEPICVHAAPELFSDATGLNLPQARP